MFDGKEKCRRWVFLRLKKMKERGRERRWVFLRLKKMKERGRE
uniref:Uncharacterized protein n=1 Tax=Cucumis melo TaxID=3656 RepID=A0A9I9DBW6_CUCME